MQGTAGKSPKSKQKINLQCCEQQTNKRVVVVLSYTYTRTEAMAESEPSVSKRAREAVAESLDDNEAAKQQQTK